MPRRLAALAILLALAAPARGEELSHDEALAAVRRGAIRPLAEIEAAVRERLPGEIIEVEIERQGGRYVYEFKILDAAGRRREVHVDAATGAILERGRR